MRDDAGTDLLLSTVLESPDGRYIRSEPRGGAVTTDSVTKTYLENGHPATRRTVARLKADGSPQTTTVSVTLANVDGTSSTSTQIRAADTSVIATTTRIRDGLGRTLSAGGGRTPVTT